MTDTQDAAPAQADIAETAENAKHRIRFEYTEDDMVAAQMAWWSGSASWQTFARFAGFIGVLYVGLLYLMNWDAPTSPAEIAGAVLVALIVTIGGFAIGYVITPRRARKNYREYKAMRGQHEVAWDDETIRMQSQLGSNAMPWTTFHCWLDAPETLLLYQASNLFHALPKRAFSDAEFKDMIRCLRAAGVPEKPRFGFVKSGA